MPPKCKLHKSTGKLKSFPKRAPQTPVTQPSTSSSSNDIENSEMARQFEVELCWCIQQLQTALKSGKLAERQAQDHKKALNVLMSNSARTIKKRQVMRLSFGDYRAKMEAEDKKMNSVNKQIKVNPLAPSKKSVFIKKASTALHQNGNVLADAITNVTLESEGSEEINSARDEGKPAAFKFTHTNNSFKFNFNNE